MRHHVAVSVVGTERLQDSDYFRAKLAQEQQIKSAPVPYTLLHVTQFFEFVRSIAGFSMIDGAVRLPPVMFQPIAAEDVADAVVEAALATPANTTIEVRGPDDFTLDEPVRLALAHDGDPREVIADSTAPYFGVQVTERTLVPATDARRGKVHFDWWLANVPSPPRK